MRNKMYNRISFVHYQSYFVRPRIISIRRILETSLLKTVTLIEGTHKRKIFHASFSQERNTDSGAIIKAF